MAEDYKIQGNLKGALIDYFASLPTYKLLLELTKLQPINIAQKPKTPNKKESPMEPEEKKENKSQTEDAGLKAQVAWCMDAIKVLIKYAKESGMKDPIQDPPPTEPPSNPNP